MPPRVDFYVLEDSRPQARLHFACRLAEKAFNQSHKVCIAAASAEEAGELDTLLWTFREGSFVPHEIAAGGNDAPVLIAADGLPAAMQDVLINLHPSAPEGLERFQRIAEIVDGDAVRRKQSSERFKLYRDRGLEPQTHNLSGDDR